MRRPSEDPGTRTGPNRSPHASDLDLAQRVLAGQPAARREFVDRMRCVRAILSALSSRRGTRLDPDDLDELAQVTLLRVWTKLGTFAGEARLETWVYRFCHLELMNWNRKQSRASRPGETEPEGLHPAAPQEVPRIEASEEFHALLAHLSPRESEIVELRHVQGMDAGEIGQHLGISVSTVKTQYYRALGKLRPVLEARNAEHGT